MSFDSSGSSSSYSDDIGFSDYSGDMTSYELMTITNLIIYILMGYWPIIFICSIVKLIYLFVNERELKKLQPITNIIVTISSFLYCLFFALRLVEVKSFLCFVEKLAESGIFITYLMILLFWIHSLLEEDGKIRIIRHSKIFACLVILIFVMEFIYCLIDSLTTQEKMSMEKGDKYIQFYNIYKTVISFIYCFGFCITGFLIHRKAKKLASKNLKRFRRTGMLIGTTFLILAICNITTDAFGDYTDIKTYRTTTSFIAIINMLYGVLCFLILFLVFSNDHISREKSLTSSNNSISVGQKV
ncbi:hypothetical protein DLAC_01094 [Tieghemostelium lacteum]|uniref:Uncharacterized protein n=1 Tax=Tieghemostelium lacteum TaxID=361077 RepID=A0A152A7N5_TIELA|nr:hypothetical protein DLAC_01094 [Tieghemostelium lacteum]|eukprot:KYR02263.1 hypothetical protein DLAC_01094 [Tieghemostelium lacteum]